MVVLYRAVISRSVAELLLRIFHLFSWLLLMSICIEITYPKILNKIMDTEY